MILDTYTHILILKEPEEMKFLRAIRASVSVLGGSK